MRVDSDDWEIAISLVSQYLYCKRRAALIALYNEWGDNEHTVAGTLEHERVHEAAVFGNGASKTYHGLRVKSARLGIAGVCDRVDCELDTVRYIPIEFKHGKRRNELEYEAQLCAQALCLEEMTGRDVLFGYLYFITEKRRKEVQITEALRADTCRAIAELRDIISTGTLPSAELSAKCRECSLREICIPQSPHSTNAHAYVRRVLAFAQGGDAI